MQMAFIVETFSISLSLIYSPVLHNEVLLYPMSKWPVWFVSSILLIWNHVKWVVLGLRAVFVYLLLSCMIFIWLMVLLCHLATPYLSFSFSPPNVDKNRERAWVSKNSLFIFIRVSKWFMFSSPLPESPFIKKNKK